MSRFSSFVTPTLCIFLCIFGFCYWQMQSEFSQARDNLRILRKQFIEVSESRRSLEATVQDKTNMLGTLQKDLAEIQQKQAVSGDEINGVKIQLDVANGKLKPLEDKVVDLENREKQAKEAADGCNAQITGIREAAAGAENVVEHINKLNNDLAECQKKVVSMSFAFLYLFICTICEPLQRK